MPEPRLYDYETAPQSSYLSPYGVTSRQLRRWISQGRASHKKVGQRVLFTDDDLMAIVASFQR